MNRSIRIASRALLAAALLAAALGPARAQSAAVERGRYLVTTIMACGNCHTPKDAEGRAVPGRELAGGGIGFDIPPFAGVASNITPDAETGIGTWSDDEIKRALTHGERPARGPLAGKPLAPPMATSFFKALLPGDLDAIVAYLRSVPPVRSDLPAPVHRAPTQHQPYPPAERGFTEGDLRDTVRRGEYLATIGHCLECHTPVVRGVLQVDSALGAGGRAFSPAFVKGLPEAWKGSVSRNVTADAEVGLGGWTDAQIKRAITQGIGRDGRPLDQPMGYAWYAGMRSDDLDAVVAYLRTLPARR